MNATPHLSADDLLDLADAYALHALDANEAARVEAALASADRNTLVQFETRVREIRETMAAQAATFTERPAAQTFDRILGGLVDGASDGTTPLRATVEPAAPASSPQSPSRSRRLLIGLSAAAVLVVAVAAGVLVGRGLGTGSSTPVPDTAAVLAAPDARTTAAKVGDATISLVYSRKYNAGVVLMNDVPPPKPGTVYQMWLLDPNGGPRSRGTMTQADVRPTTTAAVPSIDGATSFGISIENVGGATTPTAGQFVATLPITGA